MNFDVFIWRLDPHQEPMNRRWAGEIGSYGGPDACVKSHQAARSLCNSLEGKDKHFD
jgi:hypothetical protein